MKALPRICFTVVIAAPLLAAPSANEAARQDTVLGVRRTEFTLNGRATFLLGISYYGALGASEENIRRDLDDMQRHGFNWLRLWATWAAFSNDVSAVDANGHAREPYLSRLKWLIAQCNGRGMVVDVTLSRGNGVTGLPRLQDLAAHRQAVEALVTELKHLPNWYLDLSNERNIEDKRFTSFAALKELRETVRKLDPERLVTASHAGDIPRTDLPEYLRAAQVDFLSPHRPRDPKSPTQTSSETKRYLADMKALGRLVPVHYQEPFRRGFGSWNPAAEDFATDLKQARQSGAAGWCFHNGDERAHPEGRPRRSFDLREQRLFDALDDEERKFLSTLRIRE